MDEDTKKNEKKVKHYAVKIFKDILTIKIIKKR